MPDIFYIGNLKRAYTHHRFHSTIILPEKGDLSTIDMQTGIKNAFICFICDLEAYFR